MLILFLSISVHRCRLPFVSDKTRLEHANQLAAQWNLSGALDCLKLLDDSGTPGAAESKAFTHLYLGNLNEALSLFRYVTERTNSVNGLIGMSEAYYLQGNLDSAALAGGRAIDRAEQSADAEARASALNTLGRIAFNRGRYTEAEGLQREALIHARSARARQTEADVLRQLGVLSWYQGEADSALSLYYEPALQLYRKTGDRRGEATTISNIGLIYGDRAEPGINLSHQLRAFDIRRQIGDKVGLADSYYFLTHFPRLTRQMYSFAFLYRRKSLELSREIGYKWGEEVAKRSMEHLLGLDWDRYVRLAGDRSYQAEGEGVIYQRLRDGKEALASGKLLEAETLFRAAIVAFDSLGYAVGRVPAILWHGSVLASLGRFSEAERSLLAAQRITRSVTSTTDSFMADTALATFYLSRDQAARAKEILLPLAAVHDSLSIAQVQRRHRDRSYGSVETNFFGQRTDVYSLLVECLAESKDSDLFAVIERERSLLSGYQGSTQEPSMGESENIGEIVRTIEAYDAGNGRIRDIEDLVVEVGELYNNLRREEERRENIPSPLVRQPVHSPRDVQGVLSGDEILLEFFVAQRKTYLVAIRSEAFRVFEIPAGFRQMRSLVDLYHGVLLRGKENMNDDLWKGPTRNLSRILLGEISDSGFFDGVRLVMIAPHQSLQRVPFHALTVKDGTGEQFLVERYDITYLPGASHLVHLRSQETARPMKMLAVAPAGESLPYAGSEADELPRQMFSEVAVLRDSEAGAQQVREGLGRYDIVHIAGHAKSLFSFPLYSYLECHDRRLELHEILRTKPVAKVVVLSACETGVTSGAAGELERMEEPMSFAQAFLEGGARTVVATMWLLEDQTANEQMRAFYSRLAEDIQNQKGGSDFYLALARGISRVQRASLLKTADHQPHPFLWAAFFSMGT